MGSNSLFAVTGDLDGRSLVFFVAEVVGQLGIEHAVDEPLLEFCEQAVGSEEIAWLTVVLSNSLSSSSLIVGFMGYSGGEIGITCEIYLHKNSYTYYHARPHLPRIVALPSLIAVPPSAELII